jgi:GTPase SAR1 family protein
MAAGVASPSQGPTLWGSILQSASSSRATPTKGCLVLGDAQSGKSTLIAALRGSPERQPDDGSDADLALSYASTEVRDDEGGLPHVS